MYFYQKYLVYFILFGFLACTEWDLERVGFTKVLTIGSIEIGSNSAYLIGDIEDIRMARIVETGFVLSSTATDDGSLLLDLQGVISQLSPGLDTVSEDRAFAARVTGLNGSTEYYFRAYAKIIGEAQVVYGEIDRFTTTELNVSLQSVRRTSEGCPTTAIVQIQVDGLVTGSAGGIGIVFSSGVSNMAPSVDNGTLILAENPSTSGLYEIPIQVACNEIYSVRLVLNPESANPDYVETYSFTTKEEGHWEPRATFLGRQRKGKPVGFEVGGQGFLIGGNSTVEENVSDFWSFNISDNSWSFIERVDSMNISRAIYAIMDGQVYMTSGYASLEHCGKIGNIPDRNGLPTTLMYEDLCRGCPGSDCAWCGRLMLMGTGLTSASYSCVCWNTGMGIFDVETQNIEYVLESPIGRRIDMISLEIESDFYMLAGESPAFSRDNESNTGCTEWRRNCTKIVLQFHPEQPVFYDDLPGVLRFDPVGFGIGEYGYAGLGFECTDNLIEGEFGGELAPPYLSLNDLNVLSDFYQFDPASQAGSQWKEVAPFPASSMMLNVLFGVSLSDRGYVLFRTKENIHSLWQYDPLDSSQGAWKEIGPMPPIHDSDPMHLFTANNVAYIFFLERDNNFWMYVPPL